MPDASPTQDNRRSAILSLWAVGLGYLIFPISLKFGFNLILLGIVLELFRRNLQSDWAYIRTDPLAIVLAASFLLALLGELQRCILGQRHQLGPDTLLEVYSCDIIDRTDAGYCV